MNMKEEDKESKNLMIEKDKEMVKMNKEENKENY
jgi:hypothetical protein